MYTHLKVLVSFFKKTVLVFMLWLKKKILTFEVNEFSFVKFLLSQHFLKLLFGPHKTYYFLKELDKVFQMDINKLF